MLGTCWLHVDRSLAGGLTEKLNREGKEGLLQIRKKQKQCLGRHLELLGIGPETAGRGLLRLDLALRWQFCGWKVDSGVASGSVSEKRSPPAWKGEGGGDW